jgi:hypothetical protein
MELEPRTPTYILGKGGPSLVNLRVPTPAIRILVTGPGMLFEKLRLLTSLDVMAGCTVHSLRAFASRLEGIVFCGHVGARRVPIEAVAHRTGTVIEIGLGPASMYQSELLLRTSSGEPLEELLRRVLVRGELGDHLVALQPVEATGHLEHVHSSGGSSGHGPGHSHHSGGSHGHA